jgi:ornithine cyclodeaminase/alanine dehydrogenase-like protein (mu-crystallin family)
VLLLGRSTVAALLSLDDCINAVEVAFAAHSAGQNLAPGLLHVAAERGEFHIKVGGLVGARTYFAAKVNGGFFGNRVDFGLPNILGLILLADGATGVPLAVMESGWVTRLRTGAATAVAVKYLARRGSHTATICGAGIQGEIQLRSLAKVLPLRRAYIWSRSGAEVLAAAMQRELGFEVRSVKELAEATLRSDLIVTCTPAKRGFLEWADVVPGTLIAAVGADSPDKQELEPKLLAAAAVVCDLTSQCAEVGELHHALAAGLMTREQVRGELGAVIAGRVVGRRSEEEIVVFDSTGTAMQDAAAAAAVYEQAVAVGQGTPFAFWG